MIVETTTSNTAGHVPIFGSTPGRVEDGGPLPAPGTNQLFAWTLDVGTGGDPAAGKFQLNNANPTLATTIYFNTQSKYGDGINYEGLFLVINSGTGLNLTNAGKTSSFLTTSAFSITGSVASAVMSYTAADTDTLSGDYSLSIGPAVNTTITFADATARAAATPVFRGQLGQQLNDGSLWWGNSTSTGDWINVRIGLGGDGTAIMSNLLNSFIGTDSNGVLFLYGCAADSSGAGKIGFDATTGHPNLTATGQTPGSQDISTMANVASLITAALNDAGTLATILAAAGVTPAANGTVTPVTSITTVGGIPTDIS